MIQVEDLAGAALEHNALELNSLVQDLWRSGTPLASCPKPTAANPRLLSVAAALLELLAQRWEQDPPAWVNEVGGVSEPFFLLKYAEKMPHLRRLCEMESPAPLKKRGLYAPPDFLRFV